MKKMIKLLSIISILLFSFSALFADFVSDFDDAYAVSAKYNKCIKVKLYPNRNIKPSYLINNYGCTVLKSDKNLGTLTLQCPDGFNYYYAKSYDTCMDIFNILKANTPD